ncbi:MAG TPA: glycosyltransferase family 39 protein, partial [Anaerolineae bacterium]|nr:glycosyltransferase family 39 protein [Anaerolineae bacterium]
YITIPPVDYTKLTGYSVGGFIAYVAGLGALFGLYIGAIWLTMPEEAAEQTIQNNAGPRSPVSGWFVGVSSAIFAVILIFSYPLTAIDLFIYAIRTRGWALYGLNPLATPPEALPATDPWLGLAAEWMDAPSPYGPLWEWLSLGVFYLSGGAFLNHLFGLKIIAALAFLGCAWLIFQILRQLQPGWAVAGAISFAWCPLALLESVQNGHNDILMTFFLLAAVWATIGFIRHSHIRHSLILLFLALSILVKFVTILLVPFFLLAITAQAATRIKRLALIIAYGLAIGALVILSMLPMWPGWNNWAVLQAGSGAGRSLLALLILGFKDIWGVNFAFDFWRNLLFLIYALIYCYYLWQMFNSNQKSVASSQRV